MVWRTPQPQTRSATLDFLLPAQVWQVLPSATTKGPNPICCGWRGRLPQNPGAGTLCPGGAPPSPAGVQPCLGLPPGSPKQQLCPLPTRSGANTGTLTHSPERCWLPHPASPIPALPAMVKRGYPGTHEQCPINRWERHPSSTPRTSSIPVPSRTPRPMLGTGEELGWDCSGDRGSYWAGTGETPRWAR